MSGSGDVAGNQLRTIVERIENIEEEIKERTQAKKEVYLEAVRKQDQKERDEQETLVEVYLQAIKGASSVVKAA